MTLATNYKHCIVVLTGCFLLTACASTANAPIKASQLIKSANTWDGTAIVYPSGKAEITGLLIEIAPGAETGWHYHPIPSFEMVLAGELEVTLKNGVTKRIKAGEAFFEVVNTPHNGRNVGDTPVKIIAFYAGTVGSTPTVKQNIIKNDSHSDDNPLK
jgi:quercetin dioxygenase-like cupin family protein